MSTGLEVYLNNHVVRSFYKTEQNEKLLISLTRSAAAISAVYINISDNNISFNNK